MIGGIVLNGELPDKIDADFLVCADGGYDYLLKKGIKPDIMLGDMDSVQAKIDRDIIKFPVEKDETDGELALNYLLDKGYNEIALYGVFGGRPDHVEGNYNLMYIAYTRGVRAVCYGNGVTAYLTEKTINLSGIKNKTVSVVPFFDFTHINDCEGLKYPMDDLTIYRASTRGISNFALCDNIKIDIDRGLALVFVIG